MKFRPSAQQCAPIAIAFTLLYVCTLNLFEWKLLPGGALAVDLLYAAPLLAALAGTLRRGERRAASLFSRELILIAALLSLSFVPQYIKLSRSWGLPVLCAAGWLAWLALLMGFKCLLPRLSDEVSAPPRSASEQRAARRQAGLCVFLCVLCVLLLKWTRHFPYRTSPDTLYQWAQIHGEFPYNDVHSFGHTLFLKLLLGVVDDYTFVIVVQILMLSALYAMFAAYFSERGVPLHLLAPIFILAAGCRMSSIAFAPWKDLPYTFFAGLVTLLLMRWVESPESFRGRGSWRPAALGLCLAACFLMRQNGIVLLLFLGAYFLVALLRRRMFRALLATGVAAALALVSVDVFAYRALDVQPARDNGFPYQVFASGIAAVVHDPKTTEAELARIDEVLDVDWMREHYVPARIHNSLLWNHDDWYEGLSDPAKVVYNNAFVTTLGLRGREVVKLYFELLPRHFRACSFDVLVNTQIIWGHRSASAIFTDNITLLVFLLLAFAPRRRRGDLLVCAPVLLNALSIAISTITNEVRYLLPTSLLFPALLLWALARTSEPSRPQF